MFNSPTLNTFYCLLKLLGVLYMPNISTLLGPTQSTGLSYNVTSSNVNTTLIAKSCVKRATTIQQLVSVNLGLQPQHGSKVVRSFLSITKRNYSSNKQPVGVQPLKYFNLKCSKNTTCTVNNISLYTVKQYNHVVSKSTLQMPNNSKYLSAYNIKATTSKQRLHLDLKKKNIVHISPRTSNSIKAVYLPKGIYDNSLYNVPASARHLSSNFNMKSYTDTSGADKDRTDSLWSRVRSQIWFYPTPATINYTWSLGFLSGVGLIFQIVTGVFLAMHYTPTITEAFSSVDYIMREVHNGWFFRYAHSNGASMMFITTYGHILRNIYYRTYVAPRQAVWYTGMLLYVLLMATAFLGYTLPWGQMSYWGATVITSMFTVVPEIGEKLTQFIWGGPTINNATIKRFYVMHAILPIVMVLVSIVHIYLVHKHGSSNPGGFLPDDHVRFASSFIYKDLFALSLYMFIYSGLIHFYPNLLGHPDNYIEADPLITPHHIVPEWYFSPYYAMLRAIPDKEGGAAVLFASIIVMFLLPKIDRVVTTAQPEARGSAWSAIFWLFVFDILFLGWLGAQPATTVFINAAWQMTALYFIILMVLIPAYGIFEKIALDNESKTPLPVKLKIAKEVMLVIIEWSSELCIILLDNLTFIFNKLCEFLTFVVAWLKKQRFFYRIFRHLCRYRVLYYSILPMFLFQFILYLSDVHYYIT